MQAAATVAKMTDFPSVSDGYRPSEDEPFMNDRQIEYFRQKLLNWKEDILRESRETLSHLQTETENHPDLAGAFRFHIRIVAERNRAASSPIIVPSGLRR